MGRPGAWHEKQRPTPNPSRPKLVAGSVVARGKTAARPPGGNLSFYSEVSSRSVPMPDENSIHLHLLPLHDAPLSADGKPVHVRRRPGRPRKVETAPSASDLAYNAET